MVPSYRLSLMRDGIEARALLEVLEAGRDDAGNELEVDADKLKQAQEELEKLWADNTVQWYISYGAYEKAGKLLRMSVQ